MPKMLLIFAKVLAGDIFDFNQFAFEFLLDVLAMRLSLH